MFKSGFVSVIGVPNAGKSTLVNTWVRESVSIVTAKPQTTRKRTLGIAAEADKHQVIFVDTPGYVEQVAGLNSYLMSELEEALRGVNLIVAAIAPWEFEKSEKPWALCVGEKLNTPFLFISTQSDKILDQQQILEKWKRWTDRELLFTSSKTSDGIKLAFEKILALLPEGPAYYDMDIYTTQTMRELSSEIIRKSCFENLHQEVPYGLAINMRAFKEEQVYKVHADIVLNREGHKAMVIGQKGQMLKSIGTQSRLEMEKVFGCPVFLKLHVVVKPQWVKNPHLMEELGYVSQKE